MALREIIKEFIIVACKVNGRQNAEEYLSALTDTDEKNYDVFWDFAITCNNTLLSVMDQLGYCARDEKLIDAIYEILTARQFDITKTDEGGHIAAFFRRRGKRSLLMSIVMSRA